MATLTKEQVEQKKQLLAEKLDQIKVIDQELKDSGIMELSEEELDEVAGGESMREMTQRVAKEVMGSLKARKRK